MRKARVLYKNEEAGILVQHDDGSFTFEYKESWMLNQQKPSISLSFPKSKKVFRSKHLFPVFYNMLPEGRNREAVVQLNRVEQDDHFAILTIVAKNDSIGVLRVVKETDDD
jgi:serine/threonine-protein kinase HipA